MKRLDKTDKILFIILAIFIAVVLSVFVAVNVGAEPREKIPATGHASIEAVQVYMNYFIERPKRLAAALKFAPLIVAIGQEWNINPLLIMFITDRENSMRFGKPRKGKRGEIGVMQVMPRGVCGRGQELKTTEGNIRAGTRCLSLGKEMCGDDVYGILSAYKCGTCKCGAPSSQSAIQQRVKKFRKILRDFGNL